MGGGLNNSDGEGRREDALVAGTWHGIDCLRSRQTFAYRLALTRAEGSAVDAAGPVLLLGLLLPDPCLLQSRPNVWFFGNDYISKFAQLELNLSTVLPRSVVRGRKNPLHFGFAARLHRARKVAGLSFTALAHLAGLSSAKTTSALERGDNVPRVDTAEMLARALHLAPCQLAFGVDQPWDPAASMLCDGLPQRLRETRLARGLSMREVERVAEIADSLVRMTELGRSVLTPVTVVKLAQALAVLLAWLAFGLGPMELLT